MDEQLLLELAADLGYYLAMSGAETYRIEESIVRVLKTYGYEAEAFAIPNCLTVSMITAKGTPMTRMRRIGNHGNNLDAVERYNNLSRKICTQAPAPEVALQWLKDTKENCLHFHHLGRSLGYFIGAFGYAIFYGGSILDALGAGFCGLIIFLIDLWMDHVGANQFFRTILAAFCCAAAAYAMHALGVLTYADSSIIGALMLLVPGLLFTNAMRDIMYGDTNSGINRIVQVCLIAIAIALGTAGALNIAHTLWPDAVYPAALPHSPLIQNLASFIGSIGFAIYFNIHGPGGLLCATGSVLAWSSYLITVHYTKNVILGNLIGAMVASLYAECMARIRKYPAISYLVVSIFPLLPGAGVYYTMTYAVQGMVDEFANNGSLTAAIAGAIALGIILISSAFRLVTARKRPKIK